MHDEYEMKLSDRLLRHREDRPNEWDMDSFKRSAEWLELENARLQSIIDAANAQEPAASRRKDFMGNYVYRNESILGNEPLYARPIPAQQSPEQQGIINDAPVDFQQWRTGKQSPAIEITKEMVFSFCHAISDASITEHEFDEVKTGLTAALSHLQQSPAVAVPDQNWPDKLVELVTKAILFEDDGSTEQWEENINLGQAALKAIPNDWQLVPKFVTKEMRIGAWASAAEIRPNIKSMLDIMWSDLLKHSPIFSGDTSPRITEQDALPGGYREEWKRNVMLMWSCVRKYDSSIPSDVLDYMREQLLNKLNAKGDQDGK